MTALTAGAAYFSVAFAAGFVLGTIRIFLLMPVVEPLVAVLIELPFMLAISWFACSWIVRRFAVPAETGVRVAVGATAFILLMIAEYVLAFALAGIPIPAYLAQYATPVGLLGLAGQIAFAAFPLIQTNRGS